MVKMKEIKEVLASSRFHIALMIYTAVMVPVLGFMWAVVSAILIFVVLSAWLGKSLRIETKTESDSMAIGVKVENPNLKKE